MGHNRGTIFLVVGIVHEHVILFRVDYGFDKLSGVVAFTLQDLANDVHDFRAKGWASHEDTLDDGRSKSFQLGVAILD